MTCFFSNEDRHIKIVSRTQQPLIGIPFQLSQVFGRVENHLDRCKVVMTCAPKHVIVSAVALQSRVCLKGRQAIEGCDAAFTSWRRHRIGPKLTFVALINAALQHPISSRSADPAALHCSLDKSDFKCEFNYQSKGQILVEYLFKNCDH